MEIRCKLGFLKQKTGFFLDWRVIDLAMMQVAAKTVSHDWRDPTGCSHSQLIL